MYSQHVPQINAAMRHDVEAFARGVEFAFVSARIQFYLVPDVLHHVRENGAKSRHLFSWKRSAYAYLHEHKQDLWERVIAAGADTEKALRVLCEVPGIGLTKGAFVLQFMGHDIACIDSRNADREGVDKAFYMSAKGSKGQFERALRWYLGFAQGRAQELWDTWCEQIGGIYNMSAEQVSRIHVDEIVPKRLRHVAPVQPVRQEQLPW